MLPSLFFLFCLPSKLIGCSRKRKSPSPSYGSDDEAIKEGPKTGQLVPKRHLPTLEILPHRYWTFYPFPTSDVIFHNRETASKDIIHSPDDVSMFAFVKKEESGRLEMRYKHPGESVDRFHIDKPVNSVSMFGDYILLTSGKDFGIFNKSSPSTFPDWYSLNKAIPEVMLHKDDYIVSGRLVSKATGYLMTSKGLLIRISLKDGDWELGFGLDVFKNVTNYGADDNLLVLVDGQRRALSFIQGDKPITSLQEPLVNFAEKANIVVINNHYVLFHTKSESKLQRLDTDLSKCKVMDIPVGADMMYFEDPYLLALDGTTFTKYDMNGNPLQRYPFEGAFRVIPDRYWEVLAVHYAEILEEDAQIQFASRKADQTLDHSIMQEATSILPPVLFQIVKSYLPDPKSEVPKSTSNVFATLISVRTRQETDVQQWKPRKYATRGMYTVYEQAGNVYIKNYKLKKPEHIDTLLHGLYNYDFELVAEGISVLIKPPSQALKYRVFGGDWRQHKSFGLGIKDIKHASFHRHNDVLYLVALTDTMIYVFIIGHQETPKSINTSKL